VRPDSLHMMTRSVIRSQLSGAALAMFVTALLSVINVGWAQPPAAPGNPNVAITSAPTNVAARVAVLTIATLPIVNAEGANVYYVDGLTRLENIMSNALAKNEVEAKAMLEQRMAAMGKQALQDQSRNAADGIALAMNHRIERVPAIIFDDRAVVYGVNDVAAARRLYAAWQRSLVPTSGVKK
jgi:integrating conjugative element protein (TIGR03757 family)